MLHLNLYPHLGVAIKVHKYLSHILKYIAQISEGAWLWVCLRLPAHGGVHVCVYVGVCVFFCITC